MSQENVEIVREAWDAYSRGDYDRIAGFHDPHIVVITLEDGAVYGNDAVLANYERWNEAWEGAETTLEEVIGQRRPGVRDGSIPRPWSSERGRSRNPPL